MTARAPLFLALVAACAAPSEPEVTTCDGREIAEAEELPFMLYTLGYAPNTPGDWIDEDVFYGLPERMILTDEATWTAQLEELGTTAELPDFSTQAAFFEKADGGGCGDPAASKAWAWSDRVRVDIDGGGGGGCDAGWQLLDVAIVDVGEADDLGWCR